MKIGLLAYATQTGLGYQTLEFYRHLKPHKTLVADLSMYNKMPIFREWYPDGRFISGIPMNADMEWLASDVDTVFVAETPLNYNLYTAARRKNTLIIQQPNPEFLDYHKRPNLPRPHVLGLPSVWKREEIEALKVARVESLPVPINRKVFKFRQINKVKTIGHIIGRPAVHDRNGTTNFIELTKRLGDRFEYVVYLQEPEDHRAVEYFEPVKKLLLQNPQIKIIINTVDAVDLYKDMDVLIFTRRYGGLCLPMQEALSCGIPVIMTDVEPNSSVLPKELLVKASRIGEFTGHTTNAIYDANMDHLQEVTENVIANISIYNQKVNFIAGQLSWEVMKDYYTNKFALWKNTLR